LAMLSRCLLALLTLMALREVMAVAALSIRNLDDGVKRRLRIRAARNGRSMESEARTILEEALPESDESDEEDFFEVLIKRFQEIGGVELDLPPRSTPVRWADFS
jgi:antitoxin FitA